MIFYLCLAIVFVALSTKDSRLWLSVGIITIAAAARFGIGADWDYYYSISTPEGRRTYFAMAGFLEGYTKEIELFQFLSNLALQLGMPRMPIITYAVLTGLILYHMLRNKQNSQSRLMLYFALPITYLMSWTTITQSLAVVLLMLSLQAYYTGKKGFAIVGLLLSTFVHISMPVFAIALLVLNSGHILSSRVLGFIIWLMILFQLVFQITIEKIPLPEVLLLNSSYFSEVKGGGGSLLVPLISWLYVIYYPIAKKNKPLTLLGVSLVISIFLAPLGTISYRVLSVFVTYFLLYDIHFFRYINANVFRRMLYDGACISMFLLSIFIGRHMYIPYSVI